ncbi:MotA/TolQ/ExbB proton channel family protein [Opitutaceae bacterium EW11]|nr:MotA/TolQ/ExbB proton channel family protein [Opitutaceae bacterium EW11]
MSLALESLPVAFIMGQSPMELFKHGGPIMWPIALVSFVAVTIVLERVFFLVTDQRTREPEIVNKMFDRIEEGAFEDAIKLSKTTKDYVARILGEALTYKDYSLSSAFLRAASSEVARIQQGHSVLDTCVTAAPLLGLLGTVTGMMNTFGALGDGDIAASASKITGGVGEALIATACGLVIAIIGLIPYNILNTRVETTKREISQASYTLDVILKKAEADVTT